MMPPAHVCTPLLIDAAINAQMQASAAQLQDAIWQSQMNSTASPMHSQQGQAGIIQAATYCVPAATTFDPAALTTQAAVPVNGWWHKQQAKLHADVGDKIVGRIAFWREIPIVGPWRINRLADRLEQISDSVERELERA